MENKKYLLLPRVCFIAVLVVAALWTLLSEMDVLPSEYVERNADVEYAMSLASIVTALGGTYLALRFLSLKRVKAKLAALTDIEQQAALYKRLTLWRTLVLLVALWTNVVIYYASAYASSSKYCVLIALVAFVFCWPSVGEFNALKGEKS